MRWKLFVLASFAVAIIGFGLWCALAIGFFGTARELARHDWILLASALIPLGVTAYAAVFVYRHTARRRRTQAVLTAVLSLVLTFLSYIIASTMWPDRLLVPRTSELRHAR